MQLKLNWDRVGIMTSVICAIHCALLPLIITSLPVLGVNIIHNAYFEWGMIFLAYAVGSYSLYHGFIRHHRQWTPVILFTVGCVFLAAKQFTESWQYVFLLLAVILIISAHYMNYRLCHRSKCKSPHHSH
jgi:hypothetical protein